MRSIVFFICSLYSLLSFSQVDPLINNDWQNYQWPYNAYFPLNEHGINGHVGNACGPTAMARVIQYHQFPLNGTGTIDYVDDSSIRWMCTFDTLNLIYEDMPYELGEDDPQAVYHETAKLMFGCGVLGTKFRVGNFEGIYRMKNALVDHMHYDTTARIINRWENTREEWIDFFKTELDNGRPVIIAGRSPNSPPPWEPGGWDGHYFVCDGYNAKGEFYMNYSSSGIMGYFDIDYMHYYQSYHRALIGLKPAKLGIDDLSDSDNFVVKLIQYPGICGCKILVNAPENSNCTIQLLDINGRYLENLLSSKLQPGRNEIPVANKSLSKGVYLLHVLIGSQNYFRKLIVS